MSKIKRIFSGSQENFYGKPLTIADREMVETNADEILKNADVENVALLVAGDPFAATTHADLVLRAKNKNIETKVIHNASIFNAVGCCGLQVRRWKSPLYNRPFPSRSKPDDEPHRYWKRFVFEILTVIILLVTVVQFRWNCIDSVLDERLDAG